MTTARRVLVCVLACLLAPASLGSVVERWYMLELMGSRAGHMRERIETRDDGTIRVASEMSLSIARGPATIRVRIDAESVERADGEPVSMRTEQLLGAAAVVTEATFAGRRATVTESQFGQRGQAREIEIQQGALMPDAARRFLRDRIAQGARTIEFASIDPMSVAVTEQRYIRGEQSVVRLAGRASHATRWTVTQSSAPGTTSTYFLDAEGELVRGEVALGGIALTMMLTERDLALAEFEPAELLVSTLVTPDRPIDSPRTTRRASYLLRLDAGTMPELPSWGAQRVERIDERTARVVIDLDRSEPAALTREQRAAALAPSAMIDSRNRDVVGLATNVQMMSREDRNNAPVLAERMRRHVHGHINRKSLDVGFATASEVARTREGDCTEHAVLLAAMLRAAGIPSRVVSGLIYVDEFVGQKGVFGFHMWTQALLPGPDGEGVWVDLDATLDRLPRDATHIGVAVSTLEGSERVNTMAAVAPLLGALSIEVERVE